MFRAYKHWLPVVVWMGVIFMMSTGLGSSEHTSRFIGPFLHWLNPQISPEAVDLAHTLVRKGGHLTEYAILALFAQRAVLKSLYPNGGANTLKVAGVTLLLVAAYAATDEFHQVFVSSRGPAIHDVLIDILGGLVALTISSLWRKPAIRRPATSS